jgi:hypothetical protein
MRTAVFLLGGVALLAVAILAAWYASPRKHAATALVALAFIPLWFGVAAWNLWSGLAAGYSVAAEAPVFAAIFLPPAALAVWIRRRFKHA